jgi:hypothetical protein
MAYTNPLDERSRGRESHDNESQELAEYIGSNGEMYELDPDSPFAQRPDIRRNETPWDKIRNRLV